MNYFVEPKEKSDLSWISFRLGRDNYGPQLDLLVPINGDVVSSKPISLFGNVDEVIAFPERPADEASRIACGHLKAAGADALQQIASLERTTSFFQDVFRPCDDFRGLAPFAEPLFLPAARLAVIWPLRHYGRCVGQELPKGLLSFFGFRELCVQNLPGFPELLHLPDDEPVRLLHSKLGYVFVLVWGLLFHLTCPVLIAYNVVLT